MSIATGRAKADAQLQSWIISDITDPRCQFNNLQVDLTGDAVLASQYARWSPCQTTIV